jgi:hypothetical protein
VHGGAITAVLPSEIRARRSLPRESRRALLALSRSALASLGTLADVLDPRYFLQTTQKRNESQYPLFSPLYNHFPLRP